MTARLPSYTLPPITAQAIRAKLAHVAATKPVRHILIRDHQNTIVGVMVDVDEFNLLVETVEVAQRTKVRDQADAGDDLAYADIFC